MPYYPPVAAGGGTATKDIDYFTHIGTTPFERWYTAPMLSGFSSTNGLATPIGIIRAFPFVTPRGGTIDKASVNVTVAAVGGLATIALYEATSDTNLYPAALVADFGEVLTATTGVKTLTINQVLTAGKLYWFATWFGVAAPSVRSGSLAIVQPVLGLDSGLSAPGVGVQATLTYAATCPDPFPSGTGTIGSTPMPLVGIHFSA
ncbi:MAG: hypothetical protein LC798_19415 [Chloroflexi bacterium]|nr:hypothetical protein [Chloroflexota bacterium]